MIDDWVERYVFSLQVSLSRLHIVGAVVALNEALKFTIHNGTMSQGTFFTWDLKLQSYRCQGIHKKNKAFLYKTNRKQQICKNEFIKIWWTALPKISPV